ncbi:cell division protein FtsQ/DivIB [Thermogemmatispora carboxidivorans]|uniref:cell division protein FtsQ/DivIB n=1 Tax=Thermogemmatispora carboxidivorans TaxID=1382306 RepID=UPI0009DFB844|nr:FtsQ-type POTRA domain-containing protein [Thermogemmatispora carboxidivorans]
MTEHRGEIREQIAFWEARRAEPAKGGGEQSRQRVVTTPQKIVHPAGWTAMAERRAQQRRQRQRQEGSPLVARALAQTAVRASSGQMRAVRSPAARPRSSPGPAAQIPRRSSRLQARQRRRWRRLLAALLGFVLVPAGLLFALLGPAFRIQQITVVGTQNRALIAQIQQLGLQGQNLFLVDPTALSRRIAALPLVATASVERDWPDRLQVMVSERQPVLLWKTAQGSYSVDRSGMVLAAANSTPQASQLQTVIDARAQKVTAGIRPGARLGAAEVTFAVEVFKEVPVLTGISNFTLRYESKIYVSNAGPSAQQPQTVSHTTFVIVSPAGWVAYLGGPDDVNPLANRLRELQQILVMAQQKGLHLATIDLRFGLNVVYTLQP